MRYRKRPVIVSAIQYTGNNGNELSLWSNHAVIESPILEPTKDNPSGRYVQVETLEGVITGNVGDYIIRGISGEFYPCKPDIFEKTYEMVD